MGEKRTVRVVGPVGPTGGIARYVAGQREHLGDDFDIRVSPVTVPSGTGPVWLLRALFASVRNVLSFLFVDEPDLVHVHTSHALSFYRESIFVLLAAARWDCPIIVHVHGSSFDAFVRTARGTKRRYLRYVFGRATKTIVLSGYWKTALSTIVDPDDVVVLPNAIDPSLYAPKRNDDTPHVVFISNLLERKGVNEFVTAVDTLLEDRDFRVTIAGNGPLVDAVTDLANAHRSVQYRGYVTEPEKRDILDDATIYVLPSHAEGLPIAILEAMAGGNAVISTTVGAIPEVITDENGITVEPGDVDAVTDALATLIDDPERTRRLGERNRELAETRYAWPAVATELGALYRACLDDAPVVVAIE